MATSLRGFHRTFRQLLLATVLLAARDVTAMQILVPAYFYPDASPGTVNPWQLLADAASVVPITAIVNPASGPGSAADPNYAAAIAALRQRGGQVIAYVATGYGSRDVQRVLDEVARYRQFYDIDGVFIDEMANTANQLGYYAQLHDAIRQIDGGLRIVGNPGTSTLESYLGVADTLVTFENAVGYAAAQPPSWAGGYDPERFAHLLYDVNSPDAMRQAVVLAAQRNAGFIYVTDDAGANPWDRLPGYWQAEVNAVNAVPLPGTGGVLSAALAALATWLRRRR